MTRLTFLSVLVALAIGACTAPSRHPAISGYASYDPKADGAALISAAEAQARSEHKRVLAVFGGNWCKWCRALDRTMHDDAAIAALVAKSYVVVHVDSDTNGPLDVKYKNPFVNGFPVLLVLDADDALLHTQESGALENDDKSVGHDRDKVLAFLARWAS